MRQEDHEYIKGLYPDDLAFGYKLGELRGMWSIQMDRSKEFPPKESWELY